MGLPAGIYRADHVGSLLRPKAVLAARERLAAGEITAADLRQVEDEHIAEVVKLQLRAGVRSITDGEMRRAWFHLDFLRQIEGVEVNGQINSTAQHQGPPRLVVTGRLRHPRPIQVDDFRFLQRQIEAAGGAATPKVCIPSPTMVHFRGGRASIDIAAYPDLEPSFFDDLARVYQEELADLYAAGCRMVQLDDTNLAYLCDPSMRREAEQRHGDVVQLTRQYAGLINAALSKRPRDMTVAIHLCRGNYQSSWFAQGGYGPVAEVLFKDLDVDAYFLEYDDARSGDFGPLRHLPRGKVVVLGVMSSKKSVLDDKEAMIKRLHEAAGYCELGLDQLCVSHQCGFSSTMEGNQLGEQEQWAKIELATAIAKEVWGEDTSK